MKRLVESRAAWLILGLLLLALPLSAQPAFTNSATLSLTLDGSKLLLHAGFDAMRRTYGDITNNAQNPDGATNTTPIIFKPPVELWLDNLGTYDTNGVLVGGNDGRLNGK